MRVYVPMVKALTFSNGTWHGGERQEQTDATTAVEQRQRLAQRMQLRRTLQPRGKQS